jgi:hypothetical protein
MDEVSHRRLGQSSILLPCINAAHLFAGTCSDNVRDAIVKGRWNPARKRQFNRDEVKRLKASGLSIRQVAAAMGCGRATVCVALYGQPPSKRGKVAHANDKVSPLTLARTSKKQYGKNVEESR